jgi:hypothetical protein
MNNSKMDVKIFSKDEIDSCIDFIKSQTINIFLFLSTLIDNIVISSICDCPQITAIYIFCKDQQYDNYSNEQKKVRGIFNNIDTMFKQFQEDIIFL